MGDRPVDQRLREPAADPRYGGRAGTDAAPQSVAAGVCQHGNANARRSDHVYSCRYVYPSGRIALSVAGFPDESAAKRYADTLARDRGYQVTETNLPREALYVADEVFVVGTAAEVTPVRSVDKIAIGSGRRGPVTEALQRAFFDVINGEVPDTHGWLTYVYSEEAELRAPRKTAEART